MEKSSLVQSVVVFDYLAMSSGSGCQACLEVRQLQQKKKCSGEIVCTRLTVCYRANTGCQSQLQHSFSFLTQTLTTGRDTLRKVHTRACVYVRMCYN